MKKILIFLFPLFFLFFLFSCGQSQTTIDEAKQKMLDPQTETEILSIDDVENSSDVSLSQDLEASQNIQIISQTAENFLNFDAINEQSLDSGEIEISGTTNVNVDKIEVFFSNKNSNFPDDQYTLQTFSSGDSVFRYRASSKNRVLDFGENIYLFRAYAGKEITETQIIINVENPSKNIVLDENIAGEPESLLLGQENNTILLDLPTGTAYGEPVALGESSITYSQIQGLEISKEIVTNISCDNITEYLTERISNWFYWNTCRDIIAGKGIFYNVIRLSGEEYFYERHYIDYVHGLYATYELERGIGVNPENIAEKNTELSTQSFPNVDVVNDLMKDIINS